MTTSSRTSFRLSKKQMNYVNKINGQSIIRADHLLFTISFLILFPFDCLDGELVNHCAMSSEEVQECCWKREEHCDRE